MKRGQVFVRGLNKEGKWDNIDVLDLDEESYRAFVVEMLYRLGGVTGIKSELIDEKEIIYRERA